MRILVTGGSGFVGKRLCETLQGQGHTVQVVSRDPQKAHKQLPRECDIRDSVLDFLEAPPEATFNLAGESIAAKRWSDAQKETLIQSRTHMTHQLVTLCEELQANGQAVPNVMVSGSAMGYYGDQGKRVVTEDTAAHDEFAHRLCVKWEAAAKPVEALGVRLALLRTGLVLDAGGGALPKMLPPFKLRVRRTFWQWRAVYALDSSRGSGGRDCVPAGKRRTLMAPLTAVRRTPPLMPSFPKR